MEQISTIAQQQFGNMALQCSEDSFVHRIEKSAKLNSPNFAKPRKRFQ